jgi:hypothetical protein
LQWQHPNLPVFAAFARQYAQAGATAARVHFGSRDRLFLVYGREVVNGGFGARRTFASKHAANSMTDKQ